MLARNLTLTEVQAVEQTNLSTTEKFMARITLSVWKVLKQIALDLNTPIETLEPMHIIQWLEMDRTKGDQAFIQWSDTMPNLDFADDRDDLVRDTNLTSHEKFLARLLLSAPLVLKPIAQSHQVSIADLNISQILESIQAQRHSLQW